MKKFAFFLVLAVVCTGTLVAYAADFSDFNQSHWAYEYVNTLVQSQTINGFEDGTFRPEATVTRAEFVKMIGCGPERLESGFDDVGSYHWAYEYIMTSGLEPLSENLFSPDTAIKRGDVAKLLWKRAGAAKGISVPPVIHTQGSNPEAVSWVYSNGIMTGDDNINLRLDDTLTRAEAAALIVRSKNIDASAGKTEFMKSVDGELWEVAYNSFRVADKPYDKNSFLTNGELAMAVARIICDEDTPRYNNISATASFEHKYSQALNMLCRYYLGEEFDNAEYIEKNATVKDAVAGLMFAVSRSANTFIASGNPDANYPGAASESNEKLKKLLGIAYNNGICFTTPNEMPLDKEITLEEFACLLVEFDGFSGFYTADRLGFSSYYQDYKIKTDLSDYPLNSSNYRIILDDVPSYVYEKPFSDSVTLPKDTYVFTNEFKEIFESMLVTWLARSYENGVKLAVTYLPGFSANNGNGFTMRVLVEVENTSAGKKLSDVIKLADSGIEDFVLVSGDKFYADVETGKAIDDIHIPIDNMKMTMVLR